MLSQKMSRIELRPPKLCDLRDHLTNLKNTESLVCSTQPIFGSSLDAATLETLAYVEPLFLFKMENLIVSCNYNHIYLPSMLTIAEKFGSKGTFRRNMNDWGSYFGYSRHTGYFDVSMHIRHDPSIFLPRTKYITESVTPVLISNDINDKCFAHWLFGATRFAYYLEKIYQELTNPILVFSYTPSDWQIQLLEIAMGRVGIQYTVLNGASQFQSLLFFSHQDDPILDGDYLSHLKFKGNEKKSPKRPKKIFISREDAKTRRVANLEIIKKLLSAEGFESIVMTEYSIAEQISIISSANVILFIDGSHGALLSFASSDAKIGLIRSDIIERSYGLWHWERYPVNFGLSTPSKFVAATLDSSTDLNADLIIDPHSFSQYLKSMG
jgi:hypothetical protein